MSYAIGDHFNKFICKQVKAGRYNNAGEVAREGLRLVEERETKLKAFRKHIGTAIKREGILNIRSWLYLSNAAK